MKSLLFTVLLGATVAVVLCAPSDVDVRASNCPFDPNKLNLCQTQDQKIPIPCEPWCKFFYVCDEKLHASIEECGFWKKFNATTLECSTDANCKWFEDLPPDVPVVPNPPPPPPPPPSGNDPAPKPPAGKPTGSGAVASTSAVFVIFSAAIAAFARGCF